MKLIALFAHSAVVVMSPLPLSAAAIHEGGEYYDGQPAPFEFIALEQILMTVVRTYMRE
jgi:hypothetical protein